MTHFIKKKLKAHFSLSTRHFWWLGSRVVSMLDSGAEGPGFKSQLHVGCLQLISVWTADLSVDGRRSAASRTAISGGGHIVSLPPGQ